MDDAWATTPYWACSMFKAGRRGLSGRLCVGVGWKSLYMDKERRKGLADWTSDGVKLRAQNQG